MQVVGPSLAGSARAPRGPEEPGLHGDGQIAREYIRESILQPSAYVVPGPTFAASGQSIMPAVYQTTLSPEDVDHLVAYLATIK